MLRLKNQKKLNVFIILFFVAFLIVYLISETSVTASENMEKLIQGAKKEGKLMFYSVGSAKDANSLLNRFKKKYPFIKTSFWRAGKIKLFTRVMNEYKFKKYSVDVIRGAAAHANIYKKRKMLTKYVPPESRFVPEKSRDPEGYWHGISVTSMVCGYNKRLVPASEVPKTYEDLLDPKWKGKMGMDLSKYEWFATLLQQKGEGFLENLSAQEISMRSGGSLCRQLLLAGEFSILIAHHLYHMQNEKDKGAPVDWVGLEPVIFYFAAVCLPINAPHPNAGKLFINFMLTKDGQKAVNDWGRIPVRSDVGSKYKELLDKNKTILTEIEVAERSKEINDLIKKYFR